MFESFTMKVMLVADLPPDRIPNLKRLLGRPRGYLPIISRFACVENEQYFTDTYYTTMRPLRTYRSNHMSWKAAQISYQKGQLDDEIEQDENAKVMRELFFS